MSTATTCLDLPAGKADFAEARCDFSKYCIILVSCLLLFLDAHGQSGAWIRKKDMPTPRIVTNASVINDKIYVIGGMDFNYLNIAVNEVYDPVTDTWENKKALPTRKAFPSAAAVDDIIYVIGGGFPDTTSTVNAYDPVTDSWTAKANMLSERFAAHAAVVDGIIYNIAGNHYDRNMEAYDPTIDTWTRKTDIPETWGIVRITAYDGLIYAFGGGFDTSPLSSVYAYDPKKDRWTKKKNMPTPRCACWTYLVDGKIYVIGGMDRAFGQILSNVEVYDPGSDSWETRPNMPLKRTIFAGAVVKGKIYVIGGISTWAGPEEEEVWEYDPAFHTGVAGSSELPTHFVLEQNFPNPFNPTTVVRYLLPVARDIRLAIYDMLGREVSVLVNERRDAGVHEVKFDCSGLSSGMYFYRMQAGDFVQSKALVILK
jgi:hypothetical protein